MTVTVKNIPDPVYNVIKREARKQGRSVNSQIIRALEAEATESERRRKLKGITAELEKFAASLPEMPDSLPLIRADRRR